MLRRLALFALALLAPTASSHDGHDPDHDHDALEGGARGLGAHVHGAVTVNVALEGDLIVAELDAPALQVLGFEKAPRSASERALVAEVDRWFASGREFLAVPRTAGCRWIGSDHSPPDFGGDHADYRVRASYRCAQPNQLVWVELWMLRRLKGLEKIDVNLVVPTGQRQVTLSPGSVRVSLK